MTLIHPRVLITGASRGLGLSIAQDLSRDCDLILSSRLEKKDFEKSTNGLRYSSYVQLDFYDDNVNFAEITRTIPEASVVIHNASPYSERKFYEADDGEIISFGKFLTNSALLFRNLNLGKAGKLVIIGSIAADIDFKGYSGSPLYVMYKSALQTLGSALIKEENSPSVVILNPRSIATTQECPADSVSSSTVVAHVRDAVLTSNHDRKIVPI